MRRLQADILATGAAAGRPAPEMATISARRAAEGPPRSCGRLDLALDRHPHDFARQSAESACPSPALTATADSDKIGLDRVPPGRRSAEFPARWSISDGGLSSASS
jgi:hypothetical protein